MSRTIWIAVQWSSVTKIWSSQTKGLSHNFFWPRTSSVESFSMSASWWLFFFCLTGMKVKISDQIRLQRTQTLGDEMFGQLSIIVCCTPYSLVLVSTQIWHFYHLIGKDFSCNLPQSVENTRNFVSNIRASW